MILRSIKTNIHGDRIFNGNGKRGGGLITIEKFSLKNAYLYRSVNSGGVR